MIIRLVWGCEKSWNCDSDLQMVAVFTHKIKNNARYLRIMRCCGGVHGEANFTHDALRCVSLFYRERRWVGWGGGGVVCAPIITCRQEEYWASESNLMLTVDFSAQVPWLICWCAAVMYVNDKRDLHDIQVCGFDNDCLLWSTFKNVPYVICHTRCIDLKPNAVLGCHLDTD